MYMTSMTISDYNGLRSLKLSQKFQSKNFTSFHEKISWVKRDSNVAEHLG